MGGAKKITTEVIYFQTLCMYCMYMCMKQEYSNYQLSLKYDLTEIQSNYISSFWLINTFLTSASLNLTKNLTWFAFFLNNIGSNMILKITWDLIIWHQVYSGEVEKSMEDMKGSILSWKRWKNVVKHFYFWCFHWTDRALYKDFGPTFATCIKILVGNFASIN